MSFSSFCYVINDKSLLKFNLSNILLNEIAFVDEKSFSILYFILFYISSFFFGCFECVVVLSKTSFAVAKLQCMVYVGVYISLFYIFLFLFCFIQVTRFQTFIIRSNVDSSESGSVVPLYHYPTSIRNYRKCIRHRLNFLSWFLLCFFGFVSLHGIASMYNRFCWYLSLHFSTQCVLLPSA